MIVLQTVLTPQNINCIPRGAFDILEVTDEQTNVTVIVPILSTTYGDYVTTLNAEFALVENHFYTYELKQGTNIMFKDRIFCTDQSTVAFSVNNDQYISNTTTNDFIVYE